MGSKYLQEMEMVYATLVNVAFYNHPFSEIEQHIGDDFMGYGTALDEILHGWKGFKWMISRQRSELNDNKIEIKRIPVLNQLFGEDRSAFIVEEFEITMAMGQEFHGFTMRLSTILEYDNSRWMIKHFHGSTADADTPEGNSWPIEEWKRRNAELQRLVDAKTIELSERNLELKIEAALERVRASTMGMQKSEELQAVIKVVNEQMVGLDILVDHAGFILDYRARDDMHIWLADPGGVPAEVVIPYFDSPHWNSFRDAKKTESDFFANHLSFEEKNKFYHDLFELIPGVEEETRAQYLSCPGLAISTVLLENVGLYIENFSGTPYTDEENDILMRFGKVFQQTYTRFLDLQKAEALTRETQVELSLERIRSQAAAMKQSSDLLDVVVSMRTEFISLGHEAHYFWHMLYSRDTYQKAMTSGDGTRIGFVMELPRHIHGDIPLLANWEKSDETTVIYPMDTEEALAYIHKMVTLGDFQNIDPQAPTEDDIRHIGGLTFIMARTTHGEIGYSLPGVVTDPPPEDLEILVRFAGAFDLAHLRFLDLIKAEAQTRETQIELALEKVRSRTMAMQKSEELPEAANNLFLQVQELGIPAWSAGYCIWTEDKKSSTACMSSEGVIQKPFILPNVGVGYNFQAPLEKGETFHIEELGGELISEHYEFMRTLPIFGEIIDGIIEAGHPLPTFQIFHICYFKYGYVMFITYESVPEAHDIFKRFGKVFEQTYTRFLDLQKAEAQAREAQIEAALERVRSSAMVMQSSKDLNKVAHELRKQMGQLDYKDLETCAIHLYDESPDYFVSWAAQRSPESESEIVNSYIHFPKSGVESIEEMMEGYNSGKKDYVIVNEGKKLVGMLKMLKEYAPDAYKISTSLLKDLNPEDVRSHWTISDFTGGSLVMVTLDRPDDSAHELLRRFANVFGLSYQRFKDLKLAEAQAREAQIENALEKVRSRTMAMQHSNELPDAANVLFLQVQGLGIPAWSCGYNILSADKKSSTCIMSSEGEIQIPFTLPLTEHESLSPWYKAIKNKEEFFVYEQGGEDLVEHYRYMGSLPELVATFKQFEEANIPLPTFQVNHLAAFTNGFLLFITYERVPDAHDIFKRFAKVFEQTYTRFLDLQKAEAQAREAEIETALERLRAASMAMHHSEELTSISFVMFQEIIKLGIQPWNFAFFIFHGQSDIADCFSSDQTGSFSTMVLPHKPDQFLRKTYEDWKANKTLTVQEAKGRALKKHQEYMKTIPGFDQIIKRRRTAGVKTLKKMIFNNAHFKYGYIMINTLEPQPDFWDILQRIAKVFEQTYTRFLDLQKAEAQAREAEIETALERLRAASMAMHHSEELLSTSHVMFQEIIKLGIQPWNFAFFIFHGQSDIADCFASDQTGILPTMVLPHKPDQFLRKTYEDWRANKKLTVQEAKGKALKKHQEYMKTIPGFDQIIKQRRTAGVKTLNKMIFNNAHFKYGYIMINTLEPQPDFWDILQRIAKVFEQTYTRFLDLKKAEAQAREAQIEAALERTRTQSMLMQHSEELDTTSKVFHEQLQLLGIDTEFSYVWLPDETKTEHQFWVAWNSEKNGNTAIQSKAIIYPLDKTEPYTATCIEDWESGEPVHIHRVEPSEVENFFSVWEELLMDAKNLTPEFYPDGLYYTEAFMRYGCFGINIKRHVNDEEKQILQRFSVEFERTYTRFLDLQKAEEQTRKAQIEVAVERIRAQSMAMHHPDDLNKVNTEIYKQLQLLDIDGLSGVSIWLVDENDFVKIWDLSSPGNMGDPNSYNIAYDTTKYKLLGEPIQILKESEEDYFVFEYPLEKIKKALKEWAEVDVNIANQFEEAIATGKLTQQWNPFARHSNGILAIDLTEPPNEDTKTVVTKITGAFNLAYQRFMDLQKAEAQAREFQIEAALERVRSKSMAMHKSEELADLSFELVKQVQSLGVATWFCAFNIYDDDEKGSLEWGSNAEGTYERYRTPREGVFLRYYEAGQRGEEFLVNEIGEDECPAHYEYLCSLPGVGEQLLKMRDAGIPFPTSQIDHVAFFKYGYILFITFEPEPESHDVFKRFAKVFEQTYTRFLDLQKAEVQAAIAKKQSEEIEMAYENLKATQTQLIQAEKMASLGELTAGIAHEIQNPLNFVNNFSEVSGELLDEVLEELEEGNTDDVKEIISDLKQNLEKIHHHGGRADSIVKGMLQHSRTSSGEKSPTDINELADEYLRLAYHGLRAKDNTFNAIMETDFDKSIGKIKVIPQDIGRVLLNLITNAFQAVHDRSVSAVHDRSKTSENGYKPKIDLTTNRLNDSTIEIIVADNGVGIPENIKDKIFQPFFTTKPTGQGTGLGLSLSYDIVKAHGGELIVESEEGQGTVFKMIL